MANYSMEVIPPQKEGTATVLKMTQRGNIPIIKGQGEDNYHCGACNNVICQNINRGQIINIVFVCPNCGTFNHIKGT